MNTKNSTRCSCPWLSFGVGCNQCRYLPKAAVSHYRHYDERLFRLIHSLAETSKDHIAKWQAAKDFHALFSLNRDVLPLRPSSTKFGHHFIRGIFIQFFQLTRDFFFHFQYKFTTLLLICKIFKGKKYFKNVVSFDYPSKLVDYKLLTKC